MCTAIVGVDPGSPVPVLLVGVRDEFLDRPWRAPGRHWPRSPELVGGQDLLGEGTWLAVHPGVPRAACVLNGQGAPAAQSRRRSRGDLPLRLAAHGRLGDLDPARYDPFHLLCATPDAVALWSWNGEKLTERKLGAGLHVVVNSGLEAADDQLGQSLEAQRARVAHLRSLLQRARRPEPRPARRREQDPESGASASQEADAQRSGPPLPADARTAWGEWFPHVTGGGLDTADPRALVVRSTWEERYWGTSSISLVALSRKGVRYDFCADPAAAHPVWSSVLQ